MAQVVGDKVKLDNGKVIVPSTGGWYDGQQYWGGTLSDKGVINALSNQVGAGQKVSEEVNKQSAQAQGKSYPEFKAYLETPNKNTPSGIPTPAPAPAPGAGIPSGDGGMGTGLPGGIGVAPAPALNLPDLYKSLTSSADIQGIEATLKSKADAFTSAQSKINDNPFLSEATRVGRVAKLTTDYNSSVKNEQDLLAMKKQDIQTQLDLATKQFDINSQNAKMALDQFNTLLSSGALAGASGNDIAGITKATGISSSMIQSAIKAQTAKDVKTSLTTVDDGKNIYSVLIDTTTGKVISKERLSASKPSSDQPSATAQKVEYMTFLRKDAQSGVPLQKIFQIYSGFLDPNEILQLYNVNSSWGPAKESPAELARIYGVKDSSKSPSLAEQIVQIQGGQ